MKVTYFYIAAIQSFKQRAHNLPFPSLGCIFSILVVIFLLNNSILEARTVRIGVYNNPPKIFLDKANRPCGIFIDIIKHIAEKEGWILEYIYGTWDECLMRLEKDTIDLMPDVAYSDIRKQRFDFNQITVLPSWLQIYTRKGITMMSFTDLNGKSIAVLKGSIQEQVCNDIRNRLGLHFKLLEEQDYNGTIAAVQSGKADAMAVSRFYAYVHNNNLEPTPLLLDISTLHYAAKKGKNQELLSTIDKHLIKILNNSNSIYYQSLSKWLHKKPRSFIPRYVLWMLAIISVILVLFIIVSYVFRRQIKTRTQELRGKNLQLQSAFNELQTSEERIKASLIEKERLLQELYHRTKNNMSVICSLLSLKSKIIGDPITIKFAEDIESKILSMSLVHKMLYQAADLSRIDIKEYVDEFIKASLEIYTHLINRITFNINIELIKVLIDTAIPFGFILNELLINSYKHAFPDSSKGLIEITIYKKSSDIIYFSFSDNGIGIPDNFNFKNQKTFGLPMIFEIVEKQMLGTVNFVIQNGTKCVIEFPCTLYSQRI